MATCLIGLGSNLGDRATQLLSALSELRSLPQTRSFAASSLIETAPVGGPLGQGRFLNAAALLETALPPEELWTHLCRIEQRLGRERREPGERWGPRTIDLDLLLYDQQIINTPSLSVPHPRMAERRFVLEPAAEIAPELMVPSSGRTIRDLLEKLGPPQPGESGLRVVTQPDDMQRRALQLRSAGREVSLVPTMGALHAGHLSMVRAASSRNRVVVATIFVNPTQFGPQEDFDKYPRTLESDLQALSAAGCDFVFLPSREAMYPPGCTTTVEPPEVAKPLEGVCRPGHFRGVATVVLKLFGIVPANSAYFGQKDYQQALVIRRMVEDLNLPIEIVTCPTVREPDGLALSSRNRYLSPAQRQQALALSQCLDLAERLVKEGQRDAAAVMGQMRSVLLAAGIERIDYATIADPQTLAEQSRIVLPAAALVAAFVGTTRLIDNRIL
jgi:pantoate--beta-alanine ligase